MLLVVCSARQFIFVVPVKSLRIEYLISFLHSRRIQSICNQMLKIMEKKTNNETKYIEPLIVNA
jgi:hypothetical protein